MLRLLLLILLSLPLTLRAQLNLELIAHLPYDTASLAGCWHHIDSSGREYALVGTSKGLSIVDLSNPAAPFQRFHIPMKTNNWREVRTWAGFAYVSSEALWSGITIVDLRELPDTVHWKVWHGNGAFDSLIVRGHAVQAENGRLFILGGGVATNGATICSLADPWNPEVIGLYTNNYVHDAFIRGDTMWTSEIYAGQFGVVDISLPSNPFLLATNPTPGAFNHNSGLSPDSRTLFTTDEKTNTPVGAFDVSDLNNITLLDTYKPSPKPHLMVHNVRVAGNYLVNPSYGGQLTIVDATKPDNLVETAWYVMGSSLVWDADPYLPSGILTATAKNEGLFIFKPTWRRACYLEGSVRDAVTGEPLAGVRTVILGGPDTALSVSTGVYKTGLAQPGTYSVSFTKPGYFPLTVPGVNLETAETTQLDVSLTPAPVSAFEPGVSQMTVSPNPFSDQLALRWSGADFPTGKLLRLIDASGRPVAELRLEQVEQVWKGLENLPAGAYWLLIEGGRNVISVQKW